MARSSNLDTVETFRFDVRIISVSLAPGNLTNNFKGGSVTQFSRVGFVSVTTPEFQSNIAQYRENTDNYYMRKIPGLGQFNDLTMTRGVLAVPPTEGLTDPRKDFYRWVTRVNAPNPALSTLNEFTNTSNNAILRQSENFRKDMIIILRDREGRAARRWYILNAFPVNYKGSTDLDANSQEKAIESMTVTYELAFELPSVADAAKELISNLTDSPFADIADDLDLDFGF